MIQPLFWKTLQCESEQSCTKILFIADPQIQGVLAVPSPLNYLFIWDSDRYVTSVTVEGALNYNFLYIQSSNLRSNVSIS